MLFPEKFYLDCFDKGIAGIIIMSCGVECPYEGAYEALAKRIDRVYPLMKERRPGHSPAAPDRHLHGVHPGLSERSAGR